MGCAANHVTKLQTDRKFSRAVGSSHSGAGEDSSLCEVKL